MFQSLLLISRFGKKGFLVYSHFLLANPHNCILFYLWLRSQVLLCFHSELIFFVNICSCESFTVMFNLLSAIVTYSESCKGIYIYLKKINNFSYTWYIKVFLFLQYLDEVRKNPWHPIIYFRFLWLLSWTLQEHGKCLRWISFTWCFCFDNMCVPPMCINYLRLNINPRAKVNA